MAIDTMSGFVVVKLSLVLMLVIWSTPCWSGDKKMGNSWKITDGELPESLRAKLKEVAGKKSVFETEEFPKPPWEEFPQFEPGNFGWRMGSGEEYLNGFRDWFSSLDENRASSYSVLFPEPVEWVGFYSDLRDD